MAFRLANPDRLFDKTWRPRHPLRPRLSKARRWGMLVLLVVLYGVILGYNWLTNPTRVRAMARNYLSELLGGDVQIGKANLSIFEGLRLDDITLMVHEKARPDSRIFHAQTFLVKYQPSDLLAGKLVATEIKAIDPVVMLVENAADHTWNYQRIANWNHSFQGAEGSVLHTRFPHILLRDAQAYYLELRNGKMRTVGWYALEGEFTPREDPSQYSVAIQTRGRDSMGPSIEGTFRTDGGPTILRGRNFSFGPDVEAMLMPEARQWCDWHQLQGRADVPEIMYQPGAGTEKPVFRAEITLSDVELAVHPEEWMSREQNERVQWFHAKLDEAQNKNWISPATADSLRAMSNPKPIHLRQASGTLVFTDHGIEIGGVSGKLEGNWFNIDAAINGYEPDATATINISTMPGHLLELPASAPAYLGSLPPEVQDVYERLHPKGSCTGWVKLVRDEKGGRFRPSGQLQIQDGEFSFDQLPYPLEHGTGTVVIGPDPIAQMEGIRILNCRGHGMDGGPNADATVVMDGFIGPLQPGPGVSLDIHGTNVSDEPALRDALPPAIDRGLKLFDPDASGLLPKFHGDFSCHIFSPIGVRAPFYISTNITFDRGQGMLAGFPYPLKDVSGRLEMREGFMDMVGVHMPKGPASLDVDGRVTWKSDLTPASVRVFGPDLHLRARNLPIDDDLKNALTPVQRLWLTRLGAAGQLDIDGHIVPAQNPTPNAADQVDYAMDITLHDGQLKPGDTSFTLSDVGAKMKLTPRQIVLSDMVGHRGAGIVQGYATADWEGSTPKCFVSAAAEKLPLDDDLYNALPASAQTVWAALAPKGAMDASLTYESAQKYELRIQPRDASITPRDLPYTLNHLQGLLTLSPTQITLTDVKASHGDARFNLEGQATRGPKPSWDLMLSGSQINLDQDFVDSLPGSLRDLCKSLKLSGKMAFNCSKLAYRPGTPDAPNPTQPGPNAANANASGASASSGPATSVTVQDSAAATPDPGHDLDFAAKFNLDGASFDVGFPVHELTGSVDLAALVRGGKLHRMAARIDANSLNLAGRPASDLSLVLEKTGDDPVIQFSHLQGALAGGNIAGDGQLAYPSDGSQGRYDINLVLRDADVQQLELTDDKRLNGHLTASLHMSGNWNSPESRRGHGDVSVSGKDLYNVPILMGLLQFTNLSLPLSSPFSQANTRYSIDGQKVSFEQIDLRSKDMTMSGSGEIDFAARKVSLWFVTDNPALVSLPIVGPLLHGAKTELLKIHVSGTIQNPTVSAESFSTITTTVDQVFKGD